MIKEALPEGWQVVKLGDVCETTSGGTPSRKQKEFYEGDIPWVKSGELNKGLILNTEEKVTAEAIKNSSAKVFPKGTLLIALYGATIGKLAFLGVDASTNQAICGIFKGKKVDLKYLYHFLFSKRRDLIKQGIGGAQPNISQTILKNLTLPLPPLPEQHLIVEKIEELFSELDKSIENLKTTQQQLKVYRQAVLKWAFEGKLTNEKVKDGELPEGWEWVKLISLGNLGRGKSKHRPRNDKSLFGGKYPFVQTGEVKAAGHTIKTFSQTYSDIGLAQSKLWPKGTLCITIAANIAEVAFLGFDGCFPDSIVGFKANEKLVRSEYIYYFFKGNQSRLEAFAPATAQKNINVNTLENLIIPYCDRDLQDQIIQEIESRLSVCDNMEETITTSLKQTEALRQSILKKAFDGKLIVH
jgi:type I restriction enzyme S subunit